MKELIISHRSVGVHAGFGLSSVVARMGLLCTCKVTLVIVEGGRSRVSQNYDIRQLSEAWGAT